MKISSLLKPIAGEPLYSQQFSRFLLFALSIATTAQGLNFASVPSANLDLSKLGRVGLLGDFAGISLYEFEGQNENGYSINGDQSVLAQLPNGAFTNLAAADAGIRSMCSFTLENGTTEGVIVGGNFTSLGGIESQGIAMINPNTSAVSPMMGFYGQVYALLCDEATNSVYVGGNFQGANSTNALAWTESAGWTNLPFFGFNGPVNAISKSSEGNVIFAGKFTGLGNETTPAVADQQIVNIAGANITSTSSSSTEGLSDPRNIVCKTSGVDGANSTWLLEDDINGSWTATFGFNFSPTKLRLWNTHLDGRGTETWRFTALPLNGIMNFTFTDPITGKNDSCTATCPLSSNSSIEYQDFFFVNNIGMNAFRIDISAWYGAGGGLDGIELFQNDIFAYAVDSFNEPTCANITLASKSSDTGPWVITPSNTADSQYLTASSLTSAEEATASVVFFPDIKQSGSYSVNMYTPGCLGDDTCDFRGQVNVTGIMGSNASTFETTLFQTNNYEKYDQIYFGYIEAGSSSFRPSVTLSAITGSPSNLTVVAQRVGFTLVDSTGGLNALFEYNPNQTTVVTSDFAHSTFDVAGNDLDSGAVINSLAVMGDLTFVGGDFSTTDYSNVFAVNSTGTVPLAAGGLNGEVLTMLLNDTTLYVGGNFNNTVSSKTSGLSNVAAYDTSRNTWSALGAGVDGSVFGLVPMSMNITANTPEVVIAVTGDFTKVLAFGSNSSISASGFAVWVPSRANWLPNLDVSTIFVNGQLSAAITTAGGTLFAGSLDGQQLGANGAVEMYSGPAISTFPVQLDASNDTTDSSSSNQTVSGVVTALFHQTTGVNVTILGGHFAARASNGSTVNNLVFIDGSDVVTGIGAQISNDSTFLATAIDGNTLYAGGAVNGTVNGDDVSGVISYNLKTSDFSTVQPPALSGGNETVNAIAIIPSGSDVYVGGDFTTAGSLPCPGVCVFSSTSSQWNRPGTTLSGTVNTMLFSGSNTLVVGGSLKLSGQSVFLATYNAKKSVWTTFNNAASIPGPVTSLVPASSDNSELWIAGTATNGTDFIMKYDGTNWKAVDVLGTGSKVQGLQAFSLTSNHGSSDLVPQDQALLISGALVVPGFGTASSATFNGTTLQPFLLSTKASNTPGSIAQIFTENSNFFTSSSKQNILFPPCASC